MRNTMKPKLVRQEYEKLSTFKRFKNNALKFNIKHDINTRSDINVPTCKEWLLNTFGCSSKYRRERKIINNGIKKVNEDLDILKVLKSQKVFAVELWSLLNKSQH